MQNPFPDPLSDELAVALYDSLLAGMSIGSAMRQARISLSRDYRSTGLPVCYVAENNWNAKRFPCNRGTPRLADWQAWHRLPWRGDKPPRPLLGRNLELHQIAKHFMQGRKVITVAGTGGMGKTALAATFAERFAWMWSQGVRGYSFANEVNAVNFRYALMRALFGDEAAGQGAGLSEISNAKRS